MSWVKYRTRRKFWAIVNLLVYLFVLLMFLHGYFTDDTHQMCFAGFILVLSVLIDDKLDNNTGSRF